MGCVYGLVCRESAEVTSALESGLWINEGEHGRTSALELGFSTSCRRKSIFFTPIWVIKSLKCTNLLFNSSVNSNNS